jgi:hypothetical protein
MSLAVFAVPVDTLGCGADPFIDKPVLGIINVKVHAGITAASCYGRASAGAAVTRGGTLAGQKKEGGNEKKGEQFHRRMTPV